MENFTEQLTPVYNVPMLGGGCVTRLSREAFTFTYYCQRILIDARLAANNFLIYRATIRAESRIICLSTPPRFNTNKWFFNQHWMESGTLDNRGYDILSIEPFSFLATYLSSTKFRFHSRKKYWKSTRERERERSKNNQENRETSMCLPRKNLWLSNLKSPIQPTRED